MSQKIETKLMCPKCGAPSIMHAWYSINVDIDAYLKATLLNGEINQFHCSRCGYKESMPIELFYHDMKNRYCVQLFPFEHLRDHEALNMLFTDDGKWKLDPKLLYVPAPGYFFEARVVFSMQELIHYVTFRDKLHETQLRRRKGARLLTGLGVAPGIVLGYVRNIGEEDPQLMDDARPGEIIVGGNRRANTAFSCLINAAAFVTDGGGMTCSPAIIARELGIPAVVGTKDATTVLRTGQKVIVDGTSGIVCSYKEIDE